jgi:hypothetical protein
MEISGKTILLHQHMYLDIECVRIYGINCGKTVEHAENKRHCCELKRRFCGSPPRRLALFSVHLPDLVLLHTAAQSFHFKLQPTSGLDLAYADLIPPR